jgi:rhodanese-related sulfurtransferase
MNGAMMFSNMFSRFAPGADPRTIDHEEFEQAVKAGKCIVVDVREPHEFASARIPGSFNMPMSRFDPSRLPSEKPVAPVCNSGIRSRSALGQAHATGREGVKHDAAGLVGCQPRRGALTRLSLGRMEEACRTTSAAKWRASSMR